MKAIDYSSEQNTCKHFKIRNLRGINSAIYIYQM